MVSRLPRFMNRGLIEAGTMAVGHIVQVALPRFMNRGLIEALQGRLERGDADNFPDS